MVTVPCDGDRNPAIMCNNVVYRHRSGRAGRSPRPQRHADVVDRDHIAVPARRRDQLKRGYVHSCVHLPIPDQQHAATITVPTIASNRYAQAEVAEVLRISASIHRFERLHEFGRAAFSLPTTNLARVHVSRRLGAGDGGGSEPV